MKIVSETIKEITIGDGPRIASKGSCFHKTNSKERKMNEATVKYQSIPNDEQCPTEMTNSHCRAFLVVHILKRIHKKLEYSTLNCNTCKKKKINNDISRDIVCKVKIPAICIFSSQSKCPRIDQVKNWLIKCRFLRHVMRNCVKHRSFMMKMKRKNDMKKIILNQILS